MNDLLPQCGQALYGARWRAPLARDLGITERTMRRYEAGTYPVPARHIAELHELIAQRTEQLQRLAPQLRLAA